MWIPSVRSFPRPSAGAASGRVGRAGPASGAAAGLCLLIAVGLARSPSQGLAALLGLSLWCIFCRYSPHRLWRLALFLALLAFLPVLLHPSREFAHYTLENLLRTLGAMALLSAGWQAAPRERLPARLRRALDGLEAEWLRLQRRLAAALCAHAFRSGGKPTGPRFWLARTPDLLALLYTEARLVPRPPAPADTPPDPGMKHPEDPALVAVFLGVLIAILLLP